MKNLNEPNKLAVPYGLSPVAIAKFKIAWNKMSCGFDGANHDVSIVSVDGKVFFRQLAKIKKRQRRFLS